MDVHDIDLSKCRIYGRVWTEWLDDGRSMMLLADFSFTDSKGIKYTAPKGMVFDGASIPRGLWTAWGSPFTGKYRKAAVIHDILCKTKIIPSAEANRIFYEVCIVAGEDPIKSEIMYKTLMMFCHW